METHVAGVVHDERAEKTSGGLRHDGKPPEAGRRRGRLVTLVATVFAAVCLAVVSAAPWLDQSLVWCGWLGTAAALWGATRLSGWRLVLGSSVCAVVGIAIAFHWAPEVLAYTMNSSYPLGIVVFIPLVIWDAARLLLPFLLAARFANHATSAWWVAGLAAVLLESFVPSVFPWRLGYFQIAWPWTVQAVDLFGPGWSTWMAFAHAGVIVLLGATRVEAAREKNWILLPNRLFKSAAVWLCLANFVYGIWAIGYWDRQAELSPTLRVALVQVDPTYLQSTIDLPKLTSTVAQHVDLVCWPESSGGTYERGLDRLSDAEQLFANSRDPNRGLRICENPGCSLLFGGKTYRGDRERPTELYQSAILIDKQERIVGRYHKRHLMPFGEYVPGEGWVPGINQLFSVEDVVFPGQEATVLPTETGAKLGVMLCYEDMLPAAARSLTNNSANLLVSLVNGAAFSSPLTLAQHRMLAQLRAVECRRCFFRRAATGETCVISPTGKIEAQLPIQTQSVLTARVALLDARSCYCQFGWLFPAACGVCLAVCLVCLRKTSGRRLPAGL